MTAPLLILLLVPLFLPFAVRPLAGRALDRLGPVAALRTLTLAALVLAGASVSALGALVLTGLLKLPLFAALGELVRPLPTPPDTLVLPVAAAATGILTVSAWRLLRSAVRQIHAFRTARRQADRSPAAGDLCVVDSPHPDAYALPGRPHRIVVTTAMLRSLGPAEREALFAHERAHNAGHHYRFLLAAELAAHCHPGLRRLRDTVQLAAERVADEAAAIAVGDRHLTARAIARAALATHATHSTRPDFASAATTGPVPQRVAALLAPPAHRPRTPSWIALLLVACTAFSACAAAAGVVTFHHEVEVAQGEASR
ncbi:M56 family metallopeptidase [Streptomyces sp. NPDC093598]|uniref:M56 family metallopeptidase n=1 Tax=Streptomyces sp. NPDC093598 TaxID=3366046 RepID=UPI0037FFDB5B